MTDVDRYHTLEDIFERVDAAPLDERPALLTRLCGEDTDLLRAARDLLELEPKEIFLEPPAEYDLRGLVDDAVRTFGEHRLEVPIGFGGAGVVYRACHVPTGLPRALKILNLEGSTLATRERFQRECDVLTKLQHDHIVRIHEFQVDEDPPYLVMDLVEGGTLHAELAKLHAQAESVRQTCRIVREGERPYEAMARLVETLARALQYAHDEGVIHRDVKPLNVLLRLNGEPVLADFGLARDASAASMTKSGDVEGTFAYMSPEQLAARRHDIDHRTDIYSLGVVLYELLTGLRPFGTGTSREIYKRMTQRAHTPVRQLRHEVPRDLETICHKAIERKPAHRYASMQEFADDLARFQRYEAIEAKPPRAWTRAWRHLEPHRKSLATAAAALVIAVGSYAVARHGERSALFGGFEESVRTFLASHGMREDSSRASDLLAEGQHLAERLGSLPPTTAGMLAQLQTLLDEEIARLERDTRHIQKALRPTPRTSLYPELVSRPSSELALVRMILDAYDLRRTLSPEHERMLQEISTPGVTFLPREEPDDMTGARIWYARFDVIGGRMQVPKELTDLDEAGATFPCTVPTRRPALLPPGRYRFTVEHPDGRIGEFVRDLDAPGTVTTILVRGKTSAEVRDEMVRIEGGSIGVVYDLQPSAQELAIHPVSTLDLPPFLIDRYPVTNGDYARFLEATGRPMPLPWRGIGVRPGDWYERPVTGVTMRDARDYAEFVGKRLPTRHEWELAVRGQDPDSWVGWDATSTTTMEDCVHDLESEWRHPIVEDVTHGIQQAFFWYVECIRPARPSSDPNKTTRHGLVDPVGNVWEWVEQPYFDFVYGQIEISSWSYYAVGVSASTRASRLQGRPLRYPDIRPGHNSFTDVGFRCAKSLTE
ncbi:MAG: protein kinase [Planctomycetes bacterium]|nr:protein kinase [Planctomycetota bacterium]